MSGKSSVPLLVTFGVSGHHKAEQLGDLPTLKLLFRHRARRRRREGPDSLEPVQVPGEQSFVNEYAPRRQGRMSGRRAYPRDRDLSPRFRRGCRDPGADLFC